MNLIVLFSFLTTLFFPSSAQQYIACNDSCPVDEVFSKNATQCQATCYSSNYRNLLFKCETSRGCICKDGFIRDQDTYKCIPTSSCKTKPLKTTCSLNEIYSNCNAGCQRTCKTRFRDYKCKCVPGCICKPGFVRSDINFQCVPIKLCANCPVGYFFSEFEKKCVLDCRLEEVSCEDPNEFHTECGSGCEPSCHNSTTSCTKDCKLGCFCKKGFVRDELTKKCVLRQDCTNCAENETSDWGNPLCEKTCQSINKNCTKFPLRAEYKCFCNKGYVRATDEAICIDETHCPIYN